MNSADRSAGWKFAVIWNLIGLVIYGGSAIAFPIVLWLEASVPLWSQLLSIFVLAPMLGLLAFAKLYCAMEAARRRSFYISPVQE